MRVNYSTAWTMCQKIRKAMGDRESKRLLSGIVQADESYVGGTDEGGKRGRGTDKAKVFGAVEVVFDKKGVTHPGALRLGVIPDTTKDTLTGRIREWVEGGSTVYTDQLASYNDLGGHCTHIALKSDKDTDKHGHLGWYNTMMGNLQNLIRGAHHGLDEKHLQRYLDEFCFRFNRKGSPSSVFPSLLRTCANSTPITYKQLVTEQIG